MPKSHILLPRKATGILGMYFPNAFDNNGLGIFQLHKDSACWFAHGCTIALAFTSQGPNFDAFFQKGFGQQGMGYIVEALMAKVLLHYPGIVLLLLGLGFPRRCVGSMYFLN
jgi:hypothetical protein